MGAVAENEIEFTEKVEQLKPLTIRLESDCYDDMTMVAMENNMSLAELCRIFLTRKLGLYLKNILIVEPEDSRELKREVSKIGSELEKIRIELNHIGVNYNQDVKIRNTQVQNGVTPDFSKGFNYGYDIDKLMDRYETLTKEMGKAVCTLG